MDEYYETHRGGSGNVVMASVYKDGELDCFAVFSCIEKAEAWATGFDHVSVIFSPHVVDEPEFGNATKQ